ncbi:arginase family protein [Roseomonas sp. NAR14]|uniref:Arginase family protein n=1 Tax=Roseomonas acroporae TaxID=2937791 RepID=A0A9X1YBE3_9PROT|nr:arginase family protein [Roseomonas acroporae]MCK8786622.1 arginase family protein [Roseomonas acroporae]
MTEPTPRPSFARMPTRRLDELDGVAVAVLGASHASPYAAGQSSHSAGAPGALRRATESWAYQLQQLDFDLGATLVGKEAGTRGIVDCGDVETDPSDAEGNRARIEAAVRQVLAAGAVPVVIGGDDSVPIPVFRAYEGRGPLTILQVDAHVDWGDAIKGNPYGYGSTMRRAAENPWVTGMVQVGIRGLGSGTADQTEDARGWGSRIVTAREARRMGMEAVAALLPEGGDCLIAVDFDGMDPVVMPAVAMPTPGGPGYDDMLDLFHAVAARSRIVGACFVEFVPEKDPGGLAGLTAARLIAVTLGLIRGVGR